MGSGDWNPAGTDVPGAPSLVTRRKSSWASSFPAGLHRQDKCLICPCPHPQRSSLHPNLSISRGHPCLLWRLAGGTFTFTSLLSCNPGSSRGS